MAGRRGANCPVCKKHFIDTYKLRKHRERKTPCAPILSPEDICDKSKPHRCRFCGRAFAHATSVSRHIKKSCKIAPRDGDTSGMEKLYEHVLKKQKQMEKEIKDLQAANTLLKGAAKAAIRTAPVVSNVIGNVINQSTVTVTANTQINVFGSERTDHITRGSIKELFDSIMAGPGELKELLPAAQMAIVQATMLIYSDEKHPENITCYLPNKKTDEVMVHGESGWAITPYTMAVSPMAARAINILFDKQPLPGVDGVDETADIEQCGEVLRYLANNEKALTTKPPANLRPILVRNKAMLAKYLAKLPVAD